MTNLEYCDQLEAHIDLDGVVFGAVVLDLIAMVREAHGEIERLREAGNAAMVEAFIHFSKSTDDVGREYRGCRCCGWIWMDDEPQSHRDGCAIAGLCAALKDSTND